ncbi:SDR family NAD(P)-dependent oxidoreductase [Actinomadura syzygii]|uniref:SDR family NAD(P)-dependent oxidoreductase n=1 Tax=Actinomadura syzygii TaxID=1427538 RepID=A0A5D0ULK7_9ACTN|nr:SDR family NAD(P)-dependent oxidoreductase [Actinomadura syzygii]TYC18485.1 SDR family NAD(P)-dependent oxidoreductase [Actinomadura syzygii]
MSGTGASRAVLLTGANGGIGHATARALAEEGFQVLAGVRSSVGRLSEIPGVRILPLDVTDPESIEEAVRQARTSVGDDLHAVVNNAGIIVQGPFELVPADELRRQFEVNVFGPAAVTRAFLPMLRSGRGRVVNLTAATARVAGPFFGPVSASKAALASMSDALRLELAHWGIRVVVVEPGLTDTAIFAKAAAATEAAAAELPPDRVAMYRGQLDAVNASMSKAKAAPPSVVAAAVVRALTAGRPRPRYTVGPDTRLLGLLARLPLRTRDRLLSRAIGLHKVTLAKGERPS